MKKTVLLVDDHTLFREGLADILNREADFQVVGQAGTAQEAIELVQQLNPNLVLMDFGLPDETGVVATRRIVEAALKTNVVFLTVFDTDELLFAAIRSGAKGYLLKSMSSRDLLNSLRAIERNEAALSGVMTRRLLDEFSRMPIVQESNEGRLASLTVREFEILQEISRGATNREIAQRFSLSEATVKNHIHIMLSKLGVKDRYELVGVLQDGGVKIATRRVLP